MKTKTQHTLAAPYDLTHLAMVGADGLPVFLIPSATPDRVLNAERKAERAAILRAVNVHEHLVGVLEALKAECMNRLGDGIGCDPIDLKHYVAMINTAMAKAEGGL